MRRQRTVRSLAVVGALIASVLTASCAPGTGGSTRTNFQFRANRVTVVSHNDNFVYGSSDEPYLLNVWFRVRLGEPNSAQAGVVGDRSAAISSLGNGQSALLQGAQKAAVDFNGVNLIDVDQLMGGNDHLDIIGTWTWAMERDDVSVTGVASNAASLFQDALNATLAQGGIPSDPSGLVDLIVGDLGRTISLVAGGLFGSIPGIPDDGIGSRLYLGLGTKGTLSDIVEAVAPSIALPTIGIPIVSVPPDIGGGRIFSLGIDHQFAGEAFDQGQGRHTYDLEMVDSGNPNQPPIPDFTVSTTWGSPGSPIDFDASPSYDPDGTPLTYAWEFGDFATATGALVSHSFVTGGTYPVTLTVSDTRGAARSKTVNVTIAGGPTTAPTGLHKVGSGCCDTYGDFVWDPLPGAEAYRVEMVPTLGCIATSASVEFVGQVSGGTIQKLGLCLGTRYNIRIQARANGIWGPWSATQNIVL